MKSLNFDKVFEHFLECSKVPDLSFLLSGDLTQLNEWIKGAMKFAVASAQPNIAEDGTWTCPYCGSSLRHNPHSLSRMMVEMLQALRDLGGKAESNQFAPTRSKGGNYSKMKYWDLIRKCEKSGVWELTQTCEDWLDGKIKLHKTVWTYQDKVVRFDGEQVYCWEVSSDVKRRKHYATGGQAVDPAQIGPAPPPP